MQGFSRRSIGHKLIFLFSSVAALAVGLAFFASWMYESASYKEDLEREITIIAQMLAGTAAAAMPPSHGHNSAAIRVQAGLLAVLAAEPRISGSCLYDQAGIVRASYSATHAPVTCFGPPGPRSFHFTLRELVVMYPMDGRPDLSVTRVAAAGYLSFRISLAKMYQRMLRDAGFGLLAFSLTLSLIYALSTRLQRLISNPILYLTQVAGQVSDEGDYAIRAIQWSEDEMGVLVFQFNRMMEQIHQRDRELQRIQNELEARVEERTHDLQTEIAERRLAEQELWMAKQVAEEANASKSAFLANMSHELRTPLSAVIGYSEMLEEDAEANRQFGMVPDLRHIQAAGRKLLSLINDILDLSKVEAGYCDVEMKWVPVAAIVDEVRMVLQPLARRNRNQVSVSVEAGVGRVWVDAVKFQQCLLNLLSNACKFTKEGLVSLTVSPATTNGIEVIRWQVRDTGIGIPAAEMHRLFQAFSQLDASVTRRHGGTGLGLAITKKFCEMIGATISAESEVSVGSVFTIEVAANGLGESPPLQAACIDKLAQAPGPGCLAARSTEAG